MTVLCGYFNCFFCCFFCMCVCVFCSKRATAGPKDLICFPEVPCIYVCVCVVYRASASQMLHTHYPPQWINDAVPHCCDRPPSETHSYLRHSADSTSHMSTRRETCMFLQMGHRHTRMWHFDFGLWRAAVFWSPSVLSVTGSFHSPSFCLYSFHPSVLLTPESLPPLSLIVFSRVSVSNCSGLQRDGGMERKREGVYESTYTSTGETEQEWGEAERSRTERMYRCARMGLCTLEGIYGWMRVERDCV